MATRLHWKLDRYRGAAAGFVANIDCSVMGARDFRHDGQTEPGSRCFRLASAPKTLKNMNAIRYGDTRTAILYDKASVWLHRNPNFGMLGRVAHGIFDEIAQGISNRCPISFDAHWRSRRIEADGTSSTDSPGRQIGYSFLGNLIEIGYGSGVTELGVLARHVQQLLHQPLHSRRVGT